MVLTGLQGGVPNSVAEVSKPGFIILPLDEVRQPDRRWGEPPGMLDRTCGSPPLVGRPWCGPCSPPARPPSLG